MKRKIAAILAADVFGYSKLVAEDEEETLRRLASYRAVFDDFITRGNGRVFNTAGDAILAEFSSAVEAVRCAIDVQESLRTRNLAYPASRQMTFRIGISIGDVVERDGDLLGDGVNIAARLEGLAQPGGLCVSRAVYEQVSNKMSVQFADIGEQEVKNIPNPVHAYMLSLGADAAVTPKQASPARKPSPKQPRDIAWPIAIIAASVAVLVVAGILYFVVLHPGREHRAARAPEAPAVAAAERRAQAVAARQAEPLVPETIPLVGERERGAIKSNYMPAPDHKALAISPYRAGFTSGQKDDETAKAGAMDSCQRAWKRSTPKRVASSMRSATRSFMRADARPCRRNRGSSAIPTIERPFATKDLPLINDKARSKRRDPISAGTPVEGFGAVAARNRFFLRRPAEPR